MSKENVYFWPQWTYQARQKIKNKLIPLTLIKKLNQGQIYLWRALNIYDDFLDGAGEAKKLPRANIYLRRYLKLYYTLNLPPDFYQRFNKIMTDLEKANQEEAREERLKIIKGRLYPPRVLPAFTNLDKLSQKSLALALGPLAIIYLQGEKNKLRINSFLNFFRLALAAKQLADDAQDWLEDLSQGKITAVNALVLNAARRRKLNLNLEQKPEIFYLLFASDAADLIAKEIISLCSLARQEARQANLLANNKLIINIILPLEKAVAKSAKFRALFAKSGSKML